MKRYFTSANIILITVCVFLGVKLFYKVVTTKLEPLYLVKTTVEKAAPAENETKHPLSYYNMIISRNLFNTQTGAEKKPEAVDIDKLKPTDLKLVLLGTVTGDRNKAYAVIAEVNGKNQNLYRIGDTVKNATVKMILREKVVLNVNGKDEILEIDQEQDKNKKPPGKSIGSTRQQITLKRSIMEKATGNLNNLMRQVKIRPHFKNGKPDGLTLSGIRHSSLFDNMGLKSGDIITEVDGKTIVSLDDALKLYKGMKSSSNIQLKLKRRGRDKTIDYYIE